MKKKCTKCGEIKSLSGFHRRHTTIDGRCAICADCKNATLRAWREANWQAVKANEKAYKEANREKISNKGKAYHKANADKINARRRAYRKANPHLQKEYYQANKKRFAKMSKIYRKANGDKLKASKKAYHEANADKIKIKKKAYYEANREKTQAYSRARYQDKREEILVKNKAYYEANKEKIKVRDKKYYEANREAILAKAQAYRDANADEINARTRKQMKKRYHTDPLYKLKVTYRSHTLRGFKKINEGKDIKSLDCLGCSWKNFFSHIESQFYDHPDTGEKMTFKNHSLYGWHLDHIEPLYNAKTKEDVIRLSYYTNFQPLWARENLSKGNKS